MKKIYTLAGALILAGGALAQAPYMQNDYVYAPNDKYAPEAISTISIRPVEASFDREVYYSENFDAGFGGWVDEIIEGPVGFKLTDTGHENDEENTFQIPTLESDSPTQWILLDSDGDGEGYGTPEEATLTSPMIDLSAAAGSFVALTFQQFFAEWQPVETTDHCYVGVSTDGVEWTEVEINEGVGREARPNPELVSWDITDLIEGDEGTVWVRFRWDGAWNYGWQIDNVQIEDINESDIMMVDTYRNYDQNIVYSQVAEAQASEIVIGAIIRNIGHITQSNVGFDYVINGPDGSEVASGSSDDVIASISNGEQDTLLHATGYTPDAIGTYTIEWTATSDDEDDAMEDNVMTDDHFTLTEYTMAMDFDEGPIHEITNWPLQEGEAYFGNLMRFTNGDVASALEVQLTNYPSIAGELINATIWEIPDGGTDWFISYETDDYSITEDDLGEFVVFDLEGYDVNTASTYIFCVHQYSNAADPMFVRQGDIGFNNAQGKDETFANRGFFDRSAPIVRLRLNAGEVSINEEENNEFFAIYPNPATDILNVSFALNNSEQTQVNVLDISGKVINQVNLGTVNGKTNVSVSLEELSKGVYFIELVNSEGKQIKKFVKK